MTQYLQLDRKHPLYLSQLAEWNRARDCYEGGSRIEGRSDYLPKHERETAGNYRVRLSRAAYSNFCLPMIESFTGQIWRRGPVRELPVGLKGLAGDVDRRGTPADAFFKNVTQNAQVEGIRFVLVDYPDTSEVRSRADENAFGVRPYFIDLDPRRVLDWAFVPGPDGRERLAWVVIEEDVEVRAEPFVGHAKEKRYRLWRPDGWELWKHDAVEKGPKKLAEGRNSLGEIPLAVFYSDCVGAFQGRSALHGILSLCLLHFRKASDRDNSEFWAGMPTWVFKNWPEDQEVVIGAGNGIVTPGRDSEVEILEHSGTAIESMRRSETDLISAIFEISMRQVRRTSRLVESAESKAIDRHNLVSVLQERSRRSGRAEEQCWRWAARWMGLSPDDIRVEYNQDMDPVQIADGLISGLNQMRMNGDLSRETLWDFLRKKHVLDEDFDPELERERLRVETDAMLV